MYGRLDIFSFLLIDVQVLSGLCFVKEYTLLFAVSIEGQEHSKAGHFRGFH